MQKNYTRKEIVERVAASVMERHSAYMDKYCYELGLMTKALEGVWRITGNDAVLRYVKDGIDMFLEEDGSISGYDAGEMNLDNINTGKAFLFLFKETGNEKYKTAADTLRLQLEKQPRTHSGGFWHKRIYPHQMWLDGVYMSAPFFAEYASMFNEPDAFELIALQAELLWEHAKDPETGLLYHAWDESRGMKWADDVTGCSPNFWGRSIGWYLMALVDMLDYFPKGHTKRAALIHILSELSKAVISVQDEDSGLWYQVLDRKNEEGNYREASASCMFVYAMAKAVRMGYIGADFNTAVDKGFEGILKHLTETDEHGYINLKNVCAVAGLGGYPYRDGSVSYYVHERVATNDYKGYGPFILASVEMFLKGERHA